MEEKKNWDRVVRLRSLRYSVVDVKSVLRVGEPMDIYLQAVTELCMAGGDWYHPSFWGV